MRERKKRRLPCNSMPDFDMGISPRSIASAVSKEGKANSTNKISKTTFDVPN